MKITGEQGTDTNLRYGIVIDTMPYRNFRAGFRRGGFRRKRMYNPIQSYKQVTVDGPASRASATNIIHTIVTGVDNYAGPTAGNFEVPTGAKISSLYIMADFTNLVSVSSLLHFTVQLLRSGQGQVTPGAQGGNPQRNQVIFTAMKFLGKDQNSNYVWRLKIPKMFQRIREGDIWQLVYRCDTVFASATQVIYKFYR